MIWRVLRKIIKKIGYTRSNVFPKSTTIRIADDFVIGRYRNINIKKQAIITIGKHVEIRGFFSAVVSSGAELVISPAVFLNNYCSINCLGKVVIGENTIMGEGVKIYDHSHEYSFAGKDLKIERDKFKIGKVIIGKNCWLGSNVTILNNVEIGDNVLIGANNLIYKSIPANSLVIAKSEHSIQHAD